MTNGNGGKAARRPGALPAIAAIVLVALAGLAVYAGAYNVAADSPHAAPVLALLDFVRERSIAVRAAGISVPPDLAAPERIAAGAGLYNEMCSGCHLGPGMERTEISQGLYPSAPAFNRDFKSTPAEEFWAIKHGVKMTGMAAWGKTHSDELIWDMVAFLRKMPSLSAADYALAIKNAPRDHDEMMNDMKMDAK